MIKYVEFDSIDETGQHIIPVNSLYDLNKTASGTYSPEIMKVIHSLQRNPNRYYVVVNALGSYEVWGANRNGDAFPEDGLTHVSLRTDMGTQNDYGYKTFEYYAKWFRNHVNKPSSPSFGEVIYAYWNPVLHRVELILAIDTKKDAETIKALENGELVSVSMGCKVPWDECSICGNRAKTRKQYCIHAAKHLGEIVTEEQARQWSAQTGRRIIPGMQVFVWNYKPRFFDISKVFIGADRTSYILGKAAAKRAKAHSSLDLAEAYGITDEMIDKVAIVRKGGEITKEIGGALGPKDVDGIVTKASPEIISKAVKDKVSKSIVAEPILPKDLLDGIAKTRSLNSIFSTLLGLGIFPKPVEVQRIVLVHIGKKLLADEMDKSNEVFDYTSSGDEVDIPLNGFDDSLSRILVPYLAERSACPHFLLPRMDYVEKEASLDKYAYYSSTMGKDYWIDPDPKIGLPKASVIPPEAKALAGIAGIYTILKAKSVGIGPEHMAKIFVNKPWLAALIGGGIMYNIYQAMAKDSSTMIPASAYAGRLQDTKFTGHVKQAGDLASTLGKGVIAGLIAFPGAYFLNAAQQKSLRTTGRPLFTIGGGYLDPKKTALTTGAAVGITPLIFNALKAKK